jgi:hypothetical protein
LTHIEFVEFCLDTLSPNSVASIRKKNLGDGVHNADFIWTEIYRESGSVQLCSLAVRLVKDIITFVTEASRLTVMKKPAKSDRMILVADVYREVELSNACKSIRRVPAERKWAGNASFGGVAGVSISMRLLNLLVAWKRPVRIAPYNWDATSAGKG